MDIIIPTCDKYMPIVEANLHSINKFWKNHGEIIIIGYNKPEFKLLKNTKFISLGSDETPQKWSNGLIKFFNNYKKDRFILQMDDHCIVSNVQTDNINYIDEIMNEDETIDKVMLHPFHVNPPLKEYKHKFTDLKLLTCENNIGSTTLMPAIWRTRYILSILKERLNAHQFEQQADLYQIKNKTISTNNEILMITSLINRGIRNHNWHTCWHRDEFIFKQPDQKFITEINQILDSSTFK